MSVPDEDVQKRVVCTKFDIYVFWLSYVGLWIYDFQNFKLFVFQIFRFLSYLRMVFPETRRVH